RWKTRSWAPYSTTAKNRRMPPRRGSRRTPGCSTAGSTASPRSTAATGWRPSRRISDCSARPLTGRDERPPHAGQGAMYDWLTDHKIPLGSWIADAVDWMLTHMAWLFDAFSEGLGGAIEAFIEAMLWVPPLGLVAIFAAIGWFLHRSWKLVLVIVLSLLLVINLGYWT